MQLAKFALNVSFLFNFMSKKEHWSKIFFNLLLESLFFENRATLYVVKHDFFWKGIFYDETKNLVFLQCKWTCFFEYCC